jgi:hypothetical protein
MMRRHSMEDYLFTVNLNLHFLYSVLLRAPNGCLILEFGFNFSNQTFPTLFHQTNFRTFSGTLHQNPHP